MGPTLPHQASRHPHAWVMAMTWEDLLFAHWTVPVEQLRPHLPAGLELDTFEGAAYLGVVPFLMTGVRGRLAPPLPGTARFPELNVRTYVTAGGIGGVWFFSLDAGNPLAVRAARRLYHLPYFDADMEVGGAGGDQIRYRSRRTHRGAPAAELVMRYGQKGPVAEAAPGTLDRWLTDRLSLYAADDAGQVYRADIAHRPWPLQPAWAEIEVNRMTESIGVSLGGRPLLHFARSLGVKAWWRRAI